MPKLLNAQERAEVLRSMEMVSASGHELTDDMLLLADQLSRLHGKVRVCVESSGVHFYLASPACLESDGIIELDKLHLAVNASKYCEGDNTYVAQCMKTGEAYDVMDLLSMQPLSQRGYEDKPEVIQQAAVNNEYLEDDGKGNMVPKGPGVVTPIYLLPKTHPAREYLESRHFNPIKLYQQFRLSYGEKERDDLSYRKMLNGFRATPQGRLVFHIDVHGVCKGYQARILEMEHDGVKSFFHPYSKKWVPVLRYDETNPKKWSPVDPKWNHWDPVKYVIGHGARRNEVLMGFDAAVWHRNHHGTDFCFFMEGALDAGRIGSPALAILGKTLGAEQFKLMVGAFEKFIYIPDNDEAGKASIPKVVGMFEREGFGSQLKLAMLPDDVKDIGGMNNDDAMTFAYSHSHV